MRSPVSIFVGHKLGSVLFSTGCLIICWVQFVFKDAVSDHFSVINIKEYLETIDHQKRATIPPVPQVPMTE